MHRHEVVVLGAGPAGCAAATLLARRGHEVALIHPATTPAGALAESIPPSARRILGELGLLEAVEAAGFQPNRGNTVWWAGRGGRTERFGDDEAGFQVDRAGLEEVLVRQAESIGVRVHHDTTARRASSGGEGARADEAVIACEGPDGAVRLEAPWMIDATGRHGLLARETRRSDRATTTLALVRRFRSSRAEEPATAGHTLVESYEDGWGWSVPLAGGVRCFTAMVDQRHAELHGTDVGRMLEGELAKTTHLRGVLEGAQPLGEAWACPSSLYTSDRFARPGLLLAGDAASFIDPLSSYGVKKALSSGWLAGVAVHTALAEETMTAAALDFFDAREREVYRAYRAISASFFEDAANAYGDGYWTERAAAARAAGGHAPAVEDPDRVLPRPVPEGEVRAAFERIRARERLDAVTGRTLRRFPRAAVEGQRIVLEDHVASDAYPEGMRWVRGVDLRRLIEIAPRHDDVPDGWVAYNAAASPVTLPDYLTALSTAFAAGLLMHREG